MKAKRRLVFGCVWFFGGLLVTIGSYAAAEDDGTFTVAWGAVLWGLIQIIRGLVGLARGQRKDDAGAVHAAVREGVDRAFSQLREDERQRARATGD